MQKLKLIFIQNIIFIITKCKIFNISDILNPIWVAPLKNILKYKIIL